MSRVATGVLCGGPSSRMGRPKETLDLGGRTYLDLAVERSGGSGVLLSTGDSLVEHAGCVAVPDRRPGCGPLGGLDALLAACGADWLVVSPVDCPLLTADDLASLRRVAEDGRDDAVVTRTPDGVHFTVAAYRVDVPSDAVGAMLGEGVRRLDRLAEHLRVRFLDAADPARLLNVNTPADAAEACRRTAARSS